MTVEAAVGQAGASPDLLDGDTLKAVAVEELAGTISDAHGTERALALAAASRHGGELDFAALLFGDGLGVDQPLAGARTAGLSALDSGEAPDTDEAADFGAGGIEYGGNRLRGEPSAVASAHHDRSSTVTMGNARFTLAVSCPFPQ